MSRPVFFFRRDKKNHHPLAMAGWSRSPGFLPGRCIILFASRSRAARATWVAASRGRAAISLGRITRRLDWEALGRGAGWRAERDAGRIAGRDAVGRTGGAAGRAAGRAASWGAGRCAGRFLSVIIPIHEIRSFPGPFHRFARHTSTSSLK